jgi:hypothetical protein
MMIEVGKRYVSKAGNVILIMEKEFVGDDQNRPIKIFRGYFERIAKGQENLRGKIHKFFDDGRWFTRPGGIHDLEKELIL